MTNQEDPETLKQTIQEIQDSNEVLALSVQRTRLSVRRLRFQYATLLERLQQRVQKDQSLSCEDPLPTLQTFKEQLNKGSSTTGFIKGMKNNGFTNGLAGSSSAGGLTLYSKRKLAKLRRDPKMPKRPTNAYLFFCENNKEQLREQNGPQADMSKVLTDAWKNLTEEEKKPYFDLYSKDKTRYQKEMKDYLKEKESENGNDDEDDDEDEDEDEDDEDRDEEVDEDEDEEEDEDVDDEEEEVEEDEEVDDEEEEEKEQGDEKDESVMLDDGEEVAQEDEKEGTENQTVDREEVKEEADEQVHGDEKEDVIMDQDEDDSKTAVVDDASDLAAEKKDESSDFKPKDEVTSTSSEIIDAEKTSS